jgi:outer membrane protein OmpA-like peptidoglycan-associated protein
MPRLRGRYRINNEYIAYLMDNLNKIPSYPAPTGYRNRRVGLVLAAIVTLLPPTWVEAEAAVTLPPPPGMAPTNPPGNENGAAPQAAASASQVMRFVTLGRVTFVSDKWQLTDADKRVLDNVSAYLLANPGAERLLLDGHTDWVGRVKFNDTLSDKRAMAVQDYLIAKGVDPSLIRWKGHGERAPVDENWTRLGRDRNRQVELYAVYLPPAGVGGR